jgi:hypothetical protein
MNYSYEAASPRGAIVLALAPTHGSAWFCREYMSKFCSSVKCIVTNLELWDLMCNPPLREGSGLSPAQCLGGPKLFFQKNNKSFFYAIEI